VTCVDNHFVCDQCHSRSAVELIQTFTENSASVNPVEMATGLMHSDRIKMHGPEHHFLVPAVLIAAYCNATGDDCKQAMIATALKRAGMIPGGFCGTHGNGGAGVGTGIFISVISKATPLAGEEWGLSNLMTGKSLITIANHGGPRCCKRDVYLALSDAVDFVNEKFNVRLESSPVVCQFWENNRECHGAACPFFPR